ncbi:carbohydrate sulfotransferase 5-like [Saccoglossus kowalevskii]|uniref:Carbohydrate sulfotransferase 5-like n=1 Tax=Saccoglossus kowalevskii TaxID=10224 RepID=A0ABM0N173_SACKO|nr:PREDICTED: carbohydrate sulfotransferase 5-like [Saccoglossus kowalevskii]
MVLPRFVTVSLTIMLIALLSLMTCLMAIIEGYSQPIPREGATPDTGQISKLRKSRQSDSVHLLVVVMDGTSPSFIKELMDNDSNSMYITESSFIEGVSSPSAVEIMEAIYTCNFTKLVQTRNLPIDNPDSNKNSFIYHALSRYSFLLTQDQLSQVKNNYTTLDDVLSDICDRKRFSVIETSRLNNFQEISKLATMVNLKIIHLVRDPRATFRLKITHESTVGERTISQKDVDDFCNLLNKNAMLLQNCPDWLEGRYLLLRYEDVIMHPSQQVEHINEFLNINLRTHGVTFTHNGDDLQQDDPLSFLSVSAIQEKCSFAMKLLSYKSVNSISELTEMTSIVGHQPALRYCTRNSGGSS